MELGHFAYFMEDALAKLYSDYRRTRTKKYGKFLSFTGTFGNHLSKIIDEDEYDKKKDKAIMSICETEKLSRNDSKLINFQYKLASYDGLTDIEKGKIADVDTRTIRRWKSLPETHPQAFDFTTKKPNSLIKGLLDRDKDTIIYRDKETMID